jgi:hypothetical protein
VEETAKRLWPKRQRSGSTSKQVAAARARSSKTNTAEEAVIAIAKRMKRNVKVNATDAPGNVLVNETAWPFKKKEKVLALTNNSNHGSDPGRGGSVQGMRGRTMAMILGAALLAVQMPQAAALLPDLKMTSSSLVSSCGPTAFAGCFAPALKAGSRTTAPMAMCPSNLGTGAHFVTLL